MPHQCLNCSSVYDSTDEAILKGCPNCGRKLFLYIKKKPEKNEETVELSRREKEIVMKEVEEKIEEEELDSPIFLKLENIKVLAQGKYEIDINQLLKKEKPLIYKVEDGTYVIDLNYLRAEEN